MEFHRALDHPRVLAGVLDDLEAALSARNTGGIEGSSGAVGPSLGRALERLAPHGTVANRIEFVQRRDSVDVLELRGQLGLVDRVRLAETVTELQLQETAYHAAVAAFAGTRQPSLLDFLR